jgi:hypothetical protein
MTSSKRFKKANNPAVGIPTRSLHMKSIKVETTMSMYTPTIQINKPYLTSFKLHAQPLSLSSQRKVTTEQF